METNELNAAKERMARFMGWIKLERLHPSNIAFGHLYQHPEVPGVSWLGKMKYDTSMDWLHPVVVRLYTYQDGWVGKRRIGVSKPDIFSPIEVWFKWVARILQILEQEGKL